MQIFDDEEVVSILQLLHLKGIKFNYEQFQEFLKGKEVNTLILKRVVVFYRLHDIFGESPKESFSRLIFVEISRYGISSIIDGIDYPYHKEKELIECQKQEGLLVKQANLSQP